MGRPKKNVEKVTVTINEEVMRVVRERITLAYTGKVQYGAMARLIEALLRKWVRGEVQFDPIVLDDLDALALHTTIAPAPPPDAN